MPVPFFFSPFSSAFSSAGQMGNPGLNLYAARRMGGEHGTAHARRFKFLLSLHTIFHQTPLK
jgi:hypothetical protein